MSDSDKQWERFGREDPYFGVLTSERFRYDKLSDVAISAFFESGENHIDGVLKTIQKHVDSHFNPHECLDFGCGVGRLVIPLARRFPHVVGLDVSESMLAEAKKNCKHYDIHNVSLVQSDDDLKNVNQTFDFIHSVIVFQHIDTRRGYHIAEQLIQRLNVGGIAVLHFTYKWDTSLLRKNIHWAQKNIPLVHNLINIFRGRRINYPRIDMNYYDLNHLNFLLQKHGFPMVHIQYTNDAKHLGGIFFFKRS
ncbi:MAG: methyltransferase domain-containing protein [Chloroflexota bacterium]